MARIAQERPISAKESEIDAPGIDADAGHVSVLRRNLAQANVHLAIKSQYVPVETVQRLHAAIRKAMHNLEI